jgi:hypothetical protein
MTQSLRACPAPVMKCDSPDPGSVRDRRRPGTHAMSADMLGNLVVAVVADAALERDILCRLMRAETVVYELLDQRVVPANESPLGR